MHFKTKNLAIEDPDTRNSAVELATKLFQKHREQVFGIALRHAPSKELVEDILQQVYLEFISNLDRWDLEGDVAALLKVMARNFARRHWRDWADKLPEKQQELARRLQALSESRRDDSVEEEIEYLRICLERLPENGKKYLYQHYHDKKTIVEIAGELQKDPATLRSVFARLRRKLKECIESQIKQGERK